MNDIEITDKRNNPFPLTLRNLLINADGCSPLKRKVSQSELSKTVGITRQAINAYTLGETVPRLEEFQKIADFFHVTLDYLAGKPKYQVYSTEYIGQYKCRLCGEISNDSITHNKDLAIISIVSLCVPSEKNKSDSGGCANSNTSTLYSIHACRDGSMGLTDFIGFKSHAKLRFANETESQNEKKGDE